MNWKMCMRCEIKPVAASNGSWCRACRNAYARTHRKRWGDLSDEERRRANCRRRSHYLLKRGVLKREPCVRCGSDRAQMHHPDYSDPANVVWVCFDCHHAHHRHGTPVMPASVAA